MAVTPSGIGASISPVVGTAVNWLWGFLQLGLLVVGVYLLWVWSSYNVKVMTRSMTKSNRTIVKIVRAKRISDKKLKHPTIQLFGTLGFGGKKIPQPPADCIYPYKGSMGNTTLYDFVVKDGLYYPISNAVLGRKYLVTTKPEEEIDPEIQKFASDHEYSIKEIDKTTNEIYSLQGSGLEVSRDFDSEQSTLNDLISAAEKYKNKKPGEVYMLYGFLILSLVGAIITIVYSLYITGQITDEVNRGWELFNQWTQIAETSKVGPG